MKFEINTITKIITLKETVNLGELLDELDKLGLTWEEWDIDGGSIISVNTPTKIEP